VAPPENRPVQQPPGERRQAAQWKLIRWVERGREREIAPESEIRVQFHPSGRIEGQASVNGFRGEYRFNQDGQLVWQASGFEVEKEAGTAALLKQEQAFLKALRRTRRYQVDNGELTLESADRSVVLVFTK
jgi:heat shock protein HslJ